MSFRGRLMLFLIVTLVGVQAFTALIGYQILRANAEAQGQSELVGAAGALQRQLDLLSRRVSDEVEVLSLDYALRQAIAMRDSATEISALRNHGNRIGATRMMLVDLDGRIAIDTGAQSVSGQGFPYVDLLDSAAVDARSSGLAALDDGVYWIAVVPVLAPVPVAFIAAYLPIDDAMLEQLQSLSAVKRSIALYTSVGGQRRMAARSADFLAFASSGQAAPTPAETAVVSRDGAEFLTYTVPLAALPQSPPIEAVFAYPLSEVLAFYRGISLVMLYVLIAVLAVALFGASFIARGVARPLESLAVAARRIAAGDYTPPERRAARDEVGHLSDALINMARSIADREQALTRAIDAAELARQDAVKANDAKSQFLSNMSHELRTPLNAVIGFGEILKNQMMGPLGKPCYVDYASDIHDSGMRLLELVEEMITLSSAQAGQLKVASNPVDLGAILNESVTTLLHVADKAKVELVIEVETASWPVIHGDAPKLKQALTNLVHNAIKFTPERGRITIRGGNTSARITIAVADTGIGMRAEDIAVVLRPFHRLRSALDGKHQGAGLGLPYAKAIVEAHGGSLGVESTLGRGTVVRIELPTGSSRQDDLRAA